jgi:hypothetical protein
MTMPDGNSAAERQRDASEAKAEEKWDRWEKRAREDIVDDLMSGRSVGPRKVALQDLIADAGIETVISPGDLARLNFGSEDDTYEILRNLNKTCLKLCHYWLDSESGQSYLGDRIDNMEEDRD